MYANCDDNTNFMKNDPCVRQPLNGSVAADVAACTRLRTFDYFTGSEWPYILTFSAVILFAIGMYAVMLLMGHVTNLKLAIYMSSFVSFSFHSVCVYSQSCHIIEWVVIILLAVLLVCRS